LKYSLVSNILVSIQTDNLPAARLTPDERRRRTRQALIAAAAVVFARRGFRGASLDEVAETAGFTKGAIYSNFANKEDLFFAVVEWRDEQRLAEISQVFDQTAAAGLPALFQGVSSALGTADRDWALLETEMWLYAQREPAAMDRLVAYQQAHLAGVTRFMVSAAEAADIELRIPPADLAALMVGATTGVARLALTDPEIGQERLYHHLLRMLTEAVVEPA
jgi:AcrR family transcriptional regulator